MAETRKSHESRVKMGWFDKYVKSPGIDIGCGGPDGPNPIDILMPNFRPYDRALGHGDATLMADIADEEYLTVYTSHIIEHLYDPILAIQNWWRILKPTGHLIIVAPHRDLYEKKKRLPSIWNDDHKSFWLPDSYEPPNTFSLKHTVLDALSGLASTSQLVSLRVMNEGWEPVPENVHSHGEYGIEIIIRKD